MDGQTTLAERIAALSKPMKPRATEAKAKLTRFRGVRAALFDVYGTLVISGSGDVGVSMASASGAALEEAMRAVGIEVKKNMGQRGTEALHATIAAHHARRRAQGVLYPEVDIRMVWREVLDELGVTGVSPAGIECLAIEYECRVNPTWAMPGAAALIAGLRERGMVLGIVSNAQFFTPAVIEAMLGASVMTLGFERDLCVWSYAMLEGKPSTKLYEHAAKMLDKHHGIAAHKAVYIGNDMLNDVTAAHAAGFETVLFAGDARSLRLREEDERCAGASPGAVVTELGQVMRVV
ncbi:MAG: HAD family hydrolase [Planctomycetes bacterium]|nr:HAD family hydrolase [Planctomycetota bacterium]